MKDTHRTALIYDFDGTLAQGNLQEQSFIPNIGMSRSDFWGEVKRRTKENDADEILVYMHLMLEKAREREDPVTADALRRHGEGAKLFPGLGDGSWFRRVNEFGAEHALAVEHYIVSSGIHEMIDGCPIRDEFNKVFASKFIYENGWHHGLELG